MIRETFSFLRDRINSYLQFTLEIAEDLAVIDNTVTQGGELNAPELCLSLINVEEEKIHKEQHPYRMANNGAVTLVNPEIKLNLYMLVTANFGTGNYEDALSALSHVIGFFQSHPVFTRQNAPALHEQIEKLLVELVTLSFEQQNHLWGIIGAKYLPSVVYKVRLIRIPDTNVLQELHTITETNIHLSRS